ncbi:hypothetical protein H4Q26_000453 [Puccinia striiformis f. sp. tritici PST-130]|nr:hypothetical protein H4Q26_000453 [Puccinia striiformis f. sp. tritici PST-130]
MADKAQPQPARPGFRELADRTLSPLDKLVSQTRTLTNYNSNPLTINTANSNQLHQQQQPNSFSLTPITAEHPQQPLFNRNSDASFHTDDGPYSYQPPADHLDINAALASLSDSLRELDSTSLPSGPLRRPSTGRVNSSTATTQTPRIHIPSFYGDQESILTANSSHSNYQQQQQQEHLGNTQEVLGTMNVRPGSVPNQPNPRANMTHNLLVTPVGSQYEASRQSRDVLGGKSKPNTDIPASLKPAGRSSSNSPSRPSGPSDELDVGGSDRSNKKLSTNYSRPRREPSTTSDQASPTPPHSREMSPRDYPPQVSNHQTDPSTHKPGHAARLSIQSQSSIDTNSSSGSKRSWKKFFSRSKDEHESTTPQPSHTTTAHPPLRNPTLTTYPLSLSLNLDTTVIPTTTTYQHPQPHEALQPSQQHQQLTGQPRPGHRLSIYSLPPGDDPTMVAGEEETPRYASRSPVLFDTPSASGLPSPAVDYDDEEADPRSRHATNEPVRIQQQHQPQQVRIQAPPQQQQRQSMMGMPLHSAIAKAKASLANSGATTSSSTNKGQTAQDYLQAGITAHEQGDLERSAGLFERAAREGGGCGAGMLMWGCHYAMDGDVKSTKSERSNGSKKPRNLLLRILIKQSFLLKDAVAKSELVLAIYELGQCFMRGWGCKKDKQLAINYFELAAKLGDPDAQQELGFCYTNGKGTKKDLKLAAKYYRMAANQGIEMMGSQWIWKEKYN